MEISIFERAGKTWTRFKVKAWELQICTKLLERYVDTKKPVKQNKRYIYFEIEGDLLNQ